MVDSSTRSEDASRKPSRASKNEPALTKNWVPFWEPLPVLPPDPLDAPAAWPKSEPQLVPTSRARCELSWKMTASMRISRVSAVAGSSATPAPPRGPRRSAGRP